MICLTHFCGLTPVVAATVAVAVTKATKTLGRPLGVVGGLSISGPLAEAASVAGGLESGSDDSWPAGVGLQGSGGVPGVGGGQTQKRRNSLGEKANILRYLLQQ